MQPTPQTPFDVYIDNVKKAFDRVIVATSNVLETAGKDIEHTAQQELGVKMEEFGTICDEICLLLSYNLSIWNEQQQKESESQDISPLLPRVVKHTGAEEEEVTATELSEAALTRLKLVKRLEGQLEAARRIRSDLLSFTLHSTQEDTAMDTTT
jgi:hypothetical protein